MTLVLLDLLEHREILVLLGLLDPPVTKETLALRDQQVRQVHKGI